MKTIPYEVSPEIQANNIARLKDELEEIRVGHIAAQMGSTRIELLQAIGRIEAACARMTELARLFK